jgi:ribosome-associated translation inhibitor RaiA
LRERKVPGRGAAYLGPVVTPGDPMSTISLDYVTETCVPLPPRRGCETQAARASMKPGLQLQFIGMPASSALACAVRERVARLHRGSADLLSCRVRIERVHRPGYLGASFAARIDVRLPDQELGVNHVQHEDAHVALGDAFDAITRQIAFGALQELCAVPQAALLPAAPPGWR